MKRLLLTGLFLVSSGLLPAEESNQPKTDTALGVDQLMKEADKHKGTIVIAGVVKACYADKQKLTVIDCAEFKECGTTSCAQYVLPIEWKGEMPKAVEMVRVEGEVQRRDGKFIFVASKLETVKQEARHDPKDSK